MGSKGIDQECTPRVNAVGRSGSAKYYAQRPSRWVLPVEQSGAGVLSALVRATVAGRRNHWCDFSQVDSPLPERWVTGTRVTS